MRLGLVETPINADLRPLLYNAYLRNVMVGYDSSCYKKLHTGYRLVHISTTLNDLERPYCIGNAQFNILLRHVFKSLLCK